MTDPGPDEPPPLMRPQEVAAMFGVTSQTIGRWAAKGLLKEVLTPGGHRRYEAWSVGALYEKTRGDAGGTDAR